MSRLSRISSAKRFFLLTLIFLIITDLAILLDIPILRQLLGFLFFTTLPGLIILSLLKLNRLEPIETIVLSIGLSVFFLMAFGLLLDVALFAFGYTTPLSTVPLIVFFSLIIIVLGFIGYKRKNDFAFKLSDFKLGTREKTFLLLPAFFLVLCVFGIYLMNTTGNNALLMTLLFLIPAYVIWLAVMRRRVPEKIYPPVIFLTSISLLLMLALRSSHLIGSDVHSEYYLFQSTFNEGHWRIFLPGHPLSSCLSISLLPAIYQSLLNMNSEYLFKILYPFLFSISPLVIYIISKKYIGNFYAFLASFFFMSQIYFTGGGRVSIAILFFALAIMVLFHDGMNGFNKNTLFFIFATSTIISHYSTTYIFFFLLLLTWMGMLILSKITHYKRKSAAPSGNPDASAPQHPIRSIPQYRLKKSITLPKIALFFVMLFFWYGQVTKAPFEAGVGYVQATLMNLQELFLLEARGRVVSQALGQAVYRGIPPRIEVVASWLIIIFIAVGVLSTVVRYKKMVNTSKPEGEKIDFLSSKIDAEYFILALVCSGIMVFSVVLPFISQGYGLMRTLFQMMVGLAPFFVIGGITLSRFLKLKPHWVLLVVLILYFSCTTSIMYQIFNYPRSIVLNSEGSHYDAYYIHDEEVYAARWLKENAELETMQVFIDSGDNGRLISQGGISPTRIDEYSLTGTDREIGEGYIYLRYYNLVNGKIIAPGVPHEIPDTAEYQYRWEGKGKIYVNGGSEVYK